MENPLLNEPNLVSHLDIDLTEAAPDLVRCRLEVTEIHHQPYGLVHGGVHCAIVETLASTGAALWAMEHGMLGCVGVSNTTDFVRPMRRGVLIGEAKPIHRGRTQQLWQVHITREADSKLVARGQVRLQNLIDENQLPPPSGG